MMKTPLRDPASITLPLIERVPTYKAKLDELSQYDKRCGQARARRERGQALQRGVPAGRSKLAMAKDLVRGGSVAALDPAKEIEAADREEHEILRPAIRELNEQLAELRGELSLAVCKKLEPLHSDALRAALRAIEDLAVAFRVAAGIRARVKAAGYDVLFSLLPDGMPPAALALGDGRDGRQAAMWKSVLENHGVKLD